MIPVSIGIFWDTHEHDNTSLWMQKRDDSENPRFNGLWEFPGGKIEPGENPKEALMREIREEVGIDIEGHRQIKFFGHHKVEGEANDIILHIFLIGTDKNWLPGGQWIQFGPRENAEKVKGHTIPANQSIINNVLTWIAKARNVNGQLMIWN